MPATARRTMSDDHKQALTAGRSETRAVKTYLLTLQRHSHKPGPKRTPETVRARLVKVERLMQAEPALGDPVRMLQLVQERIDLTRELGSIESEQSIEAAQEAFIEVAAAFGARKGICYQAWREMGVPAATLKRAGIRRGAA